jgi:hypothetical protein
MVARRIGPWGMIAAAGAGYAAKKIAEKRRLNAGRVEPRY